MPKRPPQWPYKVRPSDPPAPAITDYLSDILQTLEGIEASLDLIADQLEPLEDIKTTLARLEARPPVPRRGPR